MSQDQDFSTQLRHASTEQLLRARSLLLHQLHEGSNQGVGSQVTSGLLSGAVAAGAIAAMQWVGRRFNILKSGVFSDRIVGDALGFGTMFSIVGFFQERNRQKIFSHFDQLNAIDNVLNERHVMAQTVRDPGGAAQTMVMDMPAQHGVRQPEHQGLLGNAMDLAAEKTR